MSAADDPRFCPVFKIPSAFEIPFTSKNEYMPSPNTNSHGVTILLMTELPALRATPYDMASTYYLDGFLMVDFNREVELYGVSIGWASSYSKHLRTSIPMYTCR